MALQGLRSTRGQAKKWSKMPTPQKNIEKRGEPGNVDTSARFLLFFKPRLLPKLIQNGPPGAQIHWRIPAGGRRKRRLLAYPVLNTFAGHQQEGGGHAGQLTRRGGEASYLLDNNIGKFPRRAQSGLL